MCVCVRAVTATVNSRKVTISSKKATLSRDFGHVNADIALVAEYVRGAGGGERERATRTGREWQQGGTYPFRRGNGWPLVERLWRSA